VDNAGLGVACVHDKFAATDMRQQLPPLLLGHGYGRSLNQVLMSVLVSVDVCEAG
jgi:hypothetical protein